MRHSLKLKNLFSFGSTLYFWIINFIHPAFVIEYFFHLFFGNESSMVSESILSQVFPTMVSYVVFVHFLFFLFPILDDSMLSFINRKIGACKWTNATRTTTCSTGSTSFGFDRLITECVSTHTSIPLRYNFVILLTSKHVNILILIEWYVIHEIDLNVWSLSILNTSVNRNVAQNWWAHHILVILLRRA